MDPLKKVVSSFMQDVSEYLSLVAIYGKPNHKYFNFVINRMGLLFVFLSKSEIFKNNVAALFVERTLSELKKKFLSEESNLNRSAVVFLLCKIYFTDDVANQFKLRITADEWNVFMGFIQSIEKLPDYETTRVMFYHLFTESFFKFTIRNKALALDYGEIENKNELDLNQDKIFWTDIRNQIEVLEKSELVELNQLRIIREEAMKPFEIIFQNEGLLSEALVEFDAVKAVIQRPETVEVPARVSRKQVSQACRDFLKSSRAESTDQQFEIEEIEWDSEFESDDNKPSCSKKQKTKVRAKQKKPMKKESSSSGSDSNEDFKRINRSLGSLGNIMRDMGAIDHCSDKLKKYYEHSQIN